MPALPTFSTVLDFVQAAVLALVAVGALALGKDLVDETAGNRPIPQATRWALAPLVLPMFGAVLLFVLLVEPVMGLFRRRR